MGDLFAPTFVIAIFLAVLIATLIIALSEIFTKLKHLETLINIKKEIKQKSEEPLTATDIKIDKFERGKCPVCGSTVWHSDKRCKNCGQKIKWDNEDESKNDS